MPAPRKSAKAKGRPRTKEPAGRERPIEQYDHESRERLNNPPVGLVTPETDPATGRKDTDYDGRSLLPRQVFFPMADEAGGWARRTRRLRAEIDEERIEAYRGTVSLPFEPGAHRRAAVKIVDDRGIESLKILEVK